MTETPSYQWLRYDTATNKIVGCKEIVDASTFIIEGNRKDYLTIRWKEANKFWTWSNEDAEVCLEPEDQDNVLQRFDINTTFGEGLIRFNGLNHETRILRFIDGKLCSSNKHFVAG